MLSSMLNHLYRTLTEVGAPFLHLYLKKRLKEGREDPVRFAERMGNASVLRPLGPLIWCHAASVGEAASLLALVEKLRVVAPHAVLLMTTGTVTSARMVQQRLPSNVIHQYIPVDRMPYVIKFLDYWRPDLVLWVESELWPNMLTQLKRRHVPLVLLNGRMSERSFRHWKMARGMAADILSAFALCLVQSDTEKIRYQKLGAQDVRTSGNIKYAASLLPYDEAELDALKQSVQDRPLWLMASSHRGEEALVVATHKTLVKKWPNLLTIIVPRHATRGPEIRQLIESERVVCAQRSQKESITATTAIYLADTMNELGLFYRLCPIVAMGASFAALGGHNPIEPAQLGQALIFGPYMHNFSEIAQAFQAETAAIQLSTANELVSTLELLLQNEPKRLALGRAARILVETQSTILDNILQDLQPWLSRPGFV